MVLQMRCLTIWEKPLAGIELIPKPPQDVRFRTPERFMIKARILLMVVPLITYATMNMICSDVP